ncbi:type VI secretion system baseplate subunit TssE [Rhizobium laguerreae]|uniref:type VI secretion system baseplate subunit TssE n=1 Tax=Rhizobium laguerreae TaxID=1076926 RepID=UPI001C90C9F4|nr:GPW/gp25 family protein [Rhizobium laguerreae]MBY3347983.1 hypothetical protein [Rhizobium laguerreae]MBY3354946.1 hypothetical protein [Rhizobium laguerreae]MBY3376251.1 hypothetical protein [Rhizobium laguerreae]MBY3431250.1 hypothetical protein [Rhizobium laguerreae]MBY3439866.1 hypothetical protein [Rhizobium laguerreae]
MAEQIKYHAPLMNAFRMSYEKGDSRKVRLNDDGETALSETDAIRRRGMSEAQIRDIVLDDLSKIFSTIDLRSVLDIDDLPYVLKSVINFGLYDIMHLTSEDMGLAEIEKNILSALRSYEPRLRAGSLSVNRSEELDDVAQKIRLAVYAEVSNRPIDIPIGFTAEVDLSSCKTTVTRGFDRS